MASPAYVQKGEAIDNAGAVSLGATLAGAVTPGNTVYAFVMHNGGSNGVIAAPAGWVFVASAWLVGCGIWCFRHIVEDAGETTTHTFTQAIGALTGVSLIEISDVDLDKQEDVSPATNTQAGTTAPRLIGPADVTAGTLLLGAITSAGGGAITVPASMTERSSLISTAAIRTKVATELSDTTGNRDGATSAQDAATIMLRLRAKSTAQTDVVFTHPQGNGPTPASAASAWGFGSWLTIYNGHPFDIALEGIEFKQPSAPALTTTYEVLFEIGTGAAGSEVTTVQHPFTFRNVTAIGYQMGDPEDVNFPEPILIPAGTRIAVRVADSHTAALTYTGFKIVFREVATAATVVITSPAALITFSSPVTIAEKVATSPASISTLSSLASVAEEVSMRATVTASAPSSSLAENSTSPGATVTFSNPTTAGQVYASPASRVDFSAVAPSLKQSASAPPASFTASGNGVVNEIVNSVPGNIVMSSAASIGEIVSANASVVMNGVSSLSETLNAPSGSWTASASGKVSELLVTPPGSFSTLGAGHIEESARGGASLTASSQASAIWTATSPASRVDFSAVAVLPATTIPIVIQDVPGSFTTSMGVIRVAEEIAMRGSLTMNANGAAAMSTSVISGSITLDNPTRIAYAPRAVATLVISSPNFTLRETANVIPGVVTFQSAALTDESLQSVVASIVFSALASNLVNEIQVPPATVRMDSTTLQIRWRVGTFPHSILRVGGNAASLTSVGDAPAEIVGVGTKNDGLRVSTEKAEIIAASLDLTPIRSVE